MKKWPYIIPFMIVGALLMAQTTYNSNRYKQAFYDATREKTHATFAKFDTASLRFDLAQTRPLVTMRGADSAKNWEFDGGKLYLKDSMSVGAGSVYFRKWFYNSADTSVGMIFYNSTLSRLDTIYGKQPGKDWLVKIKGLITDSLDVYRTAYKIDTTKIDTAQFGKFVRDHETNHAAWILAAAITDSLDAYRTNYLIDTTKIDTAQWGKFVRDHEATDASWASAIGDSLDAYRTNFEIDTTKIDTAMFGKFVRDHIYTIRGTSANVIDADFGDVTVSSASWAVEDDSHNHTSASGKFVVADSERVEKTLQVKGNLTVGSEGGSDPIVIAPTAKGAAAFSGTITTTGDLSANRTYELTDYSGIHWVTGSRFNRPHLLTSTAWAAVGKNDGNTNYVIGSSLGPMTYREEQNKTTRSWVETVTGLNLDADATVNDEGVEIYFADGVNETLGDGWIVTGTTGGKFEVTFTIGDVSACDQFMIGWRKTEAFDGANDYNNYADWSVIGIKGVDGSIFAEGEVAGGSTLSDDSGVNITDGTTHILRVDINASTRVPTAYLDGVAITLTNSGTAKTAGISMAPFITYIHANEVADPNLTINRISVWR